MSTTTTKAEHGAEEDTKDKRGEEDHNLKQISSSQKGYDSKLNFEIGGSWITICRHTPSQGRRRADSG
eukprot:12360744-Karenia_brevis.AAC.1